MFEQNLKKAKVVLWSDSWAILLRAILSPTTFVDTQFYDSKKNKDDNKTEIYKSENVGKEFDSIIRQIKRQLPTNMKIALTAYQRNDAKLHRKLTKEKGDNISESS